MPSLRSTPIVEESYIFSLRTGLVELHDRAGKLIEDNGYQPLTGSIADAEAKTFARPESLLSACAIIVQMIEMTGEHLSGFVKMITEPIESIATWTCVRSTLEASAIGCWLSEPKIDAKTRVGRTFAYRFEGLTQQLKFCTAINRPAAEIQALEKRIDDVEEVALGLGYPPVRNAQNRRIGIGQVMPSATDMISIVLDEGDMYRLLSAVAHGHSWAIMRLGFKPVTAVPQSTTPERVVVHHFEKRVYVEGLAYLGMGLAVAFARGVWNMARYFGWDQGAVANELNASFDTLQAKPAVRFWR